MPRSEPGLPRYKKIEQLGEKYGWNKISSYFANLEEDEDDEQDNRQLANLQSVFLQKMEDVSKRLDYWELHLQHGISGSFERDLPPNGKN